MADGHGHTDPIACTDQPQTCQIKLPYQSLRYLHPSGYMATGSCFLVDCVKRVCVVLGSEVRVVEVVVGEAGGGAGVSSRPPPDTRTRLHSHTSTIQRHTFGRASLARANVRVPWHELMFVDVTISRRNKEKKGNIRYLSLVEVPQKVTGDPWSCCTLLSAL